ncbi:hypothetical protein CRM22_005225 [Opisthorchis felineus]|uniref:SH2 domain-containing protein n=1 Tax=Opisthorchis felineus TaxID=147828 RepID=A0A4S2LTG2_OPIFE|nr:hypothetical protein CRM22_005225 [Opisthorchis felineus]
MNGDIQSPQQNRLHQDIAENVTLKSHRSKLREATEFESITAAEPMEEYAPPRPPLRLVFEDHGGTTAQEVEELSSTSTKSTRDSFKKKTSFAERPQVVNLSHEELVRLAKPEVMDYMDQDAERSLSEQLENCSVSTHSVYSEEGNDETEEHQPPDAGARLEQITTRIFVTLLPDDETPEQRHCDLLQAQTRLYDLTNGSKVLVVNCGEVNTQIMTIFPLIQNCPFDLDGYPDLATFIAFCERVHDWLLLSSTHVLLLHAEGVAAQTRLLLLLRSLSSYYETNERYDPTTSRMLRQYITSYPNGKLLSPVAWLRYSGLMRLFSPENSLGILRATVGIYNLAFYNFPVFEENKLRLFIKFYSGFPLRHMYTTSIHDFSSTNACNIIIRFVNDTDSSSSNVGLRLQGNISLIAYHCRPYPARRLRLFRLHLHSCQCIVGPLTFQKDDFDDLCDAFPSTMRMELHTTNRNPSTSVRVDVREERISPNSAFGESTTTGFPGSTSTPVKNHLSDPMSPDNAVRLHDSLENLNFHSAGDRRMTRYVSFSRFETLDGLIQLTGQHTLGQVNLHRLSLPPVEEHCGTYDTLAYDNTEIKGSEEPYGQPEMSPRKKRIHNIFSSTRRKTYKEATTDIIADSDLMPPPSEPLVPRKGHKRKYNVGQRLLKFLASKGGALEVPDTDKMESPEVSDLGISEGSSEESSSTSSLLNLFTRLRYRQAEHSTHSSSHKSGPPKKTRKVVTVDEMNRQIVTSVPVRPTTEDLLEAARRLNFMAGTQELDRLLEELRLTSLQMSSGLPPPSAPYSPKPYNVATHGSHTSSYRQNSSVHTHGRYNTTRSSSTIGLYGSHDPQTPNLTSPTGYNYQKRSVYHTERRLDGLTRPAHYPVLRSSMSPAPTPRHHTTYTTVLKQRPPMGPRQLSQVHLTIDPECGATDTSISNGRDISSREQRLEAELNSARQELAQLRRAISLVEERHRQEYNREVRTPVSPAHIPQTRSPLSGQNQFLSNTSSSYQTQHFGSRSTSSTFQRTTSPRQEGIYGAGFPLSKRAMSHTNVQSTRSWNLRSQNYRQGSETDLSVKTTTSASNQPGRSGYSAHRERLRQERERELLLRQQQKRQLAASSTGLNEQLHQQNRQQQQYRSLSAVNTPAVSEAVEEIETVVLQFIGRGVQDVDSQVGSMTTLPRGRGGSMMDVGPSHSKSRIRTAFSPPRASVQRTHTIPPGRHVPIVPPSNSGIRARSTSPSVTNYNPVVSQKPPHPLPLHSPVDSRYKSFLTNASTPTRELVGLSEAFDPQPRVNTPVGFMGGGPHRGGITRFERGLSVLSDSSKSPSDRIVQHPTLRQSFADDSEFAVLGSEISSVHPRREAQSKSAGTNNVDAPHVSWNGLSHTPKEAFETDSGRIRSSFAPKVPLHQSNMVGTQKPAHTGTLRTSDGDVPVSRLPVPKPLGQSPTSDSREDHYRYSQNGVTPPLCGLARLTDPLEVDVSLTGTKPVARSQMQKFIPRVVSRGDDTKMDRKLAGVSPVTVNSEQAAPLQELEKHEDMKALQLVPRSSLEFTENEHPGLQSVDSSQRGGLAKRGFSSTQFLARNNSNSDLVKPMPMHQSQTMISPSPQPLQASRFNTSATLVNHSQATVLLNGSRGHLSPTNSTAAPTTTTPVITNGWKVDGSVKQTFVDRGQDNGNLGIVQDTAPSWYRPKLSREAAINILRQQPPGNFLIRDSTTFKGAYGLAVKVATLPPKVTQKSDDLQSELVRHYLIEVVNTPIRGVRLKGFASEPVFPSLAALIHQHTIDPLALPCRLILPPVPTNLPSSGSATLPPLVIGTMKHASAVEDGAMPDNVTVASSGSVQGAPPSEVGSLHTDGPVGPPHRMDGIAQMPIQVHDNPVPSHNVPYVCVVREGSSPQRRSPLDITGNQGLTFRCLMLGSVDTPQWSSELCFARAVDQLIPLTLLTASECDHGVSRVRYTEVQLHVSAHDGITIIDLQRRLFLRRHLPNHVLLYCGLESRKKEFSHPEHQTQGLVHPKIFGIVVRKGISECTTHVFSELDRAHMADYIVKHVRATYPHMNIR